MNRPTAHSRYAQSGAWNQATQRVFRANAKSKRPKTKGQKISNLIAQCAHNSVVIDYIQMLTHLLGYFNTDGTNLQHGLNIID